MKHKKNKRPDRRESIDAETLLRWKMQIEHGDMEVIANESRIDSQTVRNALKGLATPNVRNKVQKWLDKNRPVKPLAAV